MTGTRLTRLAGQAVAAALLAVGVPVVATAPAHAADSCTASWYGAPGEIPPGSTTASGEVFDPQAMTAASPDLPFGTEVTVTDTDTGESVTVRINDRPTNTSRCIDLTLGAFSTIADPNQGLATVTLDIAGN
ncbi:MULTISPECIES: septal ring lytic transglycosylase RlpA family protein [Kitasatospora]|uniref:Septal ring lytic transglycosylase RlpA family protein n=1 Tax=Kitasatospora cystarginea TaxID=58350 RepID=A0ABP5RKB6_9ACTN